MRAYEGFFILPPDAADAQKSQLDRIEDLIRKAGGSISEKVDMGKKVLGYPLRKHSEGSVWVFNFQIPSLKATELKKSLELEEDILKYMLTVRDLRPAKKVVAKPVVATTTHAKSAQPAASAAH